MEGLLDIVVCPDISENNLSEGGNATDYQSPWALGPLPVDYNITFPCWDPKEIPKRDLFKRILDELNVYFTPVIIVIGVTGNIMSFLVFTITHLRRQSSSVYLASLALVDIGFLMSLFIVWFSWIKIPIFHRHGWCQTVVYITYVCTFLSVWYVVSFTVERYIIVWYPLRKDRYCNRKRARIVVLSLAVCACLIYSFATWTSGILDIGNIPLCMPFPQYYNFLTAMTGFDSALTLIIPSVIIIVLNIRIIMKIVKVQRQRQPMVREISHVVVRKPVADNAIQMTQNNKRLSVNESISGGLIVHVRFQPQGTSSEKREKEKEPSDSSRSPEQRSPHESDIFRKCHARVHVRNHSQHKTARMLITVSSVFVLLNLPGHVSRLNTFIHTSLDDEFSASRKLDLRWQELFQLVYHLNFAINFFIYSAYGRQFRTGLRILYTRLVHKTRKWKEVILLKTTGQDTKL